MVFSLQAAKSGLDPTTANIIIGAVQVKLIIMIIFMIIIIIVMIIIIIIFFIIIIFGRCR